MKKFVVLLVVVAMTCLTSMAFAADVTVGGTVQIRSRDFKDLDLNKAAVDGQIDTQERIQIDVNAKTDNVKGKIAIWNDFDNWGRLENVQGATPLATGTGTGGGFGNSTQANGPHFGIREAWVSFNLPGIPVNVTGGHQLLALANGWFFRSMHFGSDAWVVANQTGNNTAALVDIKVAELNPSVADDIDAYALLDVFKLNDKNTVGIDFTLVKDRKAAISANTAGTTAANSIYFTGGGAGSNAFKDINLYNLGLNYNGQLGPVTLKAQVDLQGGKARTSVAGGTDTKFKGNEVVIQGSVPLNPVTLNFTIARGSGDDVTSTSPDVKQYVNFLDIDPHYTFLYEYKVNAPAANYVTGAPSSKNQGFANTTALGVGATFAAAKSLNLGASFWFLQSTAKVNNVVSGTGTTNDLGQEIDVTANWKLYDNLSWNWTLGMLMAGDGLGKDNATGIQGILAYTF